MSGPGFATIHSLVDLIDELPLPQARHLNLDQSLADDANIPQIQNVQELQEVAANIVPALQLARQCTDFERLNFKSPIPSIKHHHNEASPLMSVIVSHHQLFQDIISVPPFQLPSHPQHPQPPPQQTPRHVHPFQLPSYQQQLPQQQQAPQQPPRLVPPPILPAYQHHNQAPQQQVPMHIQPPQMAHYQQPKPQPQQQPQLQPQPPHHQQLPPQQLPRNVSHPQLTTFQQQPSHPTPQQVPRPVPPLQLSSHQQQQPKHQQPPSQPAPKHAHPQTKEIYFPRKIHKTAKITKKDHKKEKPIKEPLNPAEFEDFLSEIVFKNTEPLSDGELIFLVRATARFKRSKYMNKLDIGKLTGLLTYLTSHITGMQDTEVCCDYAVIALNIMTSSGMDSRIFLEEIVEAIISLINSALMRITDVAPKKSNKHNDDGRDFNFDKNMILRLTTKCSEVLALINELLIARTDATLNDSLVLSASRAALTAFFSMDNQTSSNELQLNALNVITAIFASYKTHQNVILDELIHSIARLPTSKRNRIQYQIGSNNRSSGESISIFTALIMQLIQSLFTLKKNALKNDKSISSNSNEAKGIQEYEKILKSQYTSALRVSYAFLSSFLRRCCGVDKKDDCDYRVLFDTFVEDLMTCLYKPNWSSAQLLMHVLIKLLISNINPKPSKKNQLATNQTLKLASIEHLGTICSRLVKENSMIPKIKDEVTKALNAINIASPMFNNVKDSLRSRKRMNNLQKKSKFKKIHILEDSETEDDEDADEENLQTLPDDDDEDAEGILKIEEEQRFWLALLTFCHREKGISKCGRNIYCAIWLKELERRAKFIYESNNAISQINNTNYDDEASNEQTNYSKSYGRNNNEDEETAQQTNGPSAEELLVQMNRDFFRVISLSLRKSTTDESLINLETSGDLLTNNERTVTPEGNEEVAIIDEATAENVIKILDLSLSTTQKLIDAALSHIVAALSGTGNTNIRSRSMKSLSHILNDAPQDCASKLLVRDDLQKAIGLSLLDQSASVRESTVELIGRFILNSKSEDLIDKYYDMITNRIMDSGVSVRKRVIKILRDICINHPSYQRVPEICSIIIKRINDEGEGIRKLVGETFTSMWFKEERSHEAIVTKVTCITHVVATVWSRILAETLGKNIGSESHFEWLHQLLASLLVVKPTSDEAGQAVRRKSKSEFNEESGEVITQSVSNVKQALTASTQIISVLISDKLSNGSQDASSRADCLAAMTTLWSFAKIKPLLLEHHIDFFQSFLSVEVKSSFDLLIQEKVIQIVELVLPTISNPSLTTLKTIEQELAKLILGIGGIRVIPVSTSCFSEIIHKHTENYQLANDIFRKFFNLIKTYGSNPPMNKASFFLRSVYTCGLLAKHFNVRERDELYLIYVRYVESGIEKISAMKTSWQESHHMTPLDEQILLKSLEGLGFMFERSPQLMLRQETQQVYRFFMKQAVDLRPTDSAKPSICVLSNLKNYLQDEVTQEIKSALSIDWSRENLKEMTSAKQEDANSTQSSVSQLYLRDMLSCALSSDLEIRKASIKLIHSVHNGGNINPLSIIPSLIALSTDEDSSIRIRADHILQEIERKYSNFVNMKSKQGVLESFILNRRKRGFHRLSAEVKNSAGEGQSQVSTNSKHQPVNISAKLSTLYSVIATNRQNRRAFINAMLKYFDLQTLSSAPNMLSTNDISESRFVLSTCDGSDILMYVCDNLVFLPYTVMDEPFFLVHQIDITLSNLVSHTVSQFRDILQLSTAEHEEVENDVVDEEEIVINEEDLSDDTEEDENWSGQEENDQQRRQRRLLQKQNRLKQKKLEAKQRVLQQKGLQMNLDYAIKAQDDNNEIDDLPVSIKQVLDLVGSLRRCILLLHCRGVIWDLYNITEQKFEDYTPNESAKVTDKPTHRKPLDEKSLEPLLNIPPTAIHFESEPFLKLMYATLFGFEGEDDMQGLEQYAPNRHKLKLEYKRFSQMMTK